MIKKPPASNKIKVQPKNGFLVKKRKLISVQYNLLVAIENI